jgi:hypothetical protein
MILTDLSQKHDKTSGLDSFKGIWPVSSSTHCGHQSCPESRFRPGKRQIGRVTMVDRFWLWANWPSNLAFDNSFDVLTLKRLLAP